MQKINYLAIGGDQSSRWKKSTENQQVQGLEDTDQCLEVQCEDQLPIFMCNGQLKLKEPIKMRQSSKSKHKERASTQLAYYFLKHTLAFIELKFAFLYI